MWPKFIFPVVVIVYYWLLLSAVSLSTHFAALKSLQCLLTFSLLLSAQKCKITVKTKNGRIMLLSKCSVCNHKKSTFLKDQEAKWLLSNIETKTPLSKIPLLGPILF